VKRQGAQNPALLNCISVIVTKIHRQAEICQVRVGMFIKQDVVGFEIPVSNVHVIFFFFFFFFFTGSVI
jgi:hypothetical protein